LNKICGIPAICLSDNTPILTAVANDISYTDVFSQQISRQFIHLIGKENVTLIVFSGSGDSKNILDVIHYGKSLGINVIAFLGMSGGKAKLIKGIEVVYIPTEMLHAEDIHLVICHLITTLIKDAME
jgi:D-sedoheptulose 7-phosphate isomerase